MLKIKDRTVPRACIVRPDTEIQEAKHYRPDRKKDPWVEIIRDKKTPYRDSKANLLRTKKSIISIVLTL